MSSAGLVPVEWSKARQVVLTQDSKVCREARSGHRLAWNRRQGLQPAWATDPEVERITDRRQCQSMNFP